MANHLVGSAITEEAELLRPYVKLQVAMVGGKLRDSVFGGVFFFSFQRI